MRLEGTNTWIIREQGSPEMVVVDPGPDAAQHIDRIAELGDVALILISHRHSDHSAGIDRLVALTGAPVRAVRSEFLRGSAECLTDGEVIDVAGQRITVALTPGHTADSACFVLEDAVLTADTVLGRGTTVLDKEDGDLGDYLESLQRLSRYQARTVLPGHGPELPDLASVCSAYLAHRHRRLDQVRDALRTLGGDVSARHIVENVYSDVDCALWDAAESTVNAQLRYLRGH
jgi:glyoxylase-like metal-dependent hydrolase (beta-lactamase superfamily II)